MGVLLGLGLLWLVGDLLHKSKVEEDKAHLTLAHAMSRIDLSSLGIPRSLILDFQRVHSALILA